MTFPNSPLFNKTASQCRLVGARGGRARARNLRLRHAHRPAAPLPAAPEPDQETTREASLALDQQFPWLASAFGPRQTKRATIIALLRRDGGATVDEIAHATGWPRRNAACVQSAVGPRAMVVSSFRADGCRAYFVR